jgi:uncharacterized protein (TIGR00251 family)
VKIIVKAKPGARENKVEKVDENNYVVWVKAIPKDSKANTAIIKLLAEYFNTSPLYVEIVSGHMARTKVIKISE